MNQGRARTRSHTSTSLLPRYEEVAMTFQIGRAAAAVPPPPPPPEQLGGGRTETEASFHFTTFVPRCSSLLASYFLGDASDTKRVGRRQPAAAPLSQRAMVARGWKDEEGEKREKESRRRLRSKEEGKAPSLSLVLLFGDAATSRLLLLLQRGLALSIPLPPSLLTQPSCCPPTEEGTRSLVQSRGNRPWRCFARSSVPPMGEEERKARRSRRRQREIRERKESSGRTTEGVGRRRQ